MRRPGLVLESQVSLILNFPPKCSKSVTSGGPTCRRLAPLDGDDGSDLALAAGDLAQLVRLHHVGSAAAAHPERRRRDLRRRPEGPKFKADVKQVF